MSIGKTIQKYRLLRNLSQKELAVLVDMPSSQLSMIEAETSQPTIDKLIEFSIALSVSTDMLLTSEDKMFYVFAIDDCYSKLNKDRANYFINELSNMIGRNENDER